MNNYLIIFIDGFPYELLQKIDSLNKFPYKCVLAPGIGYSVNIHAEIFAGLSADQIGFLNTWKFEPESSPFRILKSIKGLFVNFEDNRYLNWFFRNTISIFCRFDSLNIPYKFIDKFAPCGCSIYSKDFPKYKLLPSEITEEDIMSKTDEQRYLLAKENIVRDGKHFLCFVELDSVAHKFGLDSNEYNNSLNLLNDRVNNLCDKFRSIHPDGHIVVLSDHGMSEVKRVIRIDLEKDFYSEGILKFTPLDSKSRWINNIQRRKHLTGFTYFLDTTMLRVWYLDPELKEAVESFLNNRDYGKLLTEQERIDFGITNKKWADSIFLLNEGCVFDPSFLEKGHPLAIHGYHPHLAWQKGIFLYSGPKVFAAQDTITTIGCFNLLKEILKSGKS